MKRYDLTALPLVRPLLKSRWPQLALQTAALSGFGVAILSGLFGSPVGSHNFSIVFVWIVWWALLMLVAVPLAGRAWCSLCPIPLPGEWAQRGAVLGPAGRASSRPGWMGRRRWPRALRGIWLQNALFALVALFSAVVLTQPRVTGAVLAGFLFAALAASLVFERRAFCRYLCPVGGFIGLYAQLAPIEVRVKDTAICAGHRDKTCYLGCAEGYGCPWNVFPASLAKNTYCGLCLECLRTCPHDNVALNLRPFGADLGLPGGRRLDEAYKAFIMLGSAVAYTAVMLGPWAVLKTAAYSVGSPGWLAYALAFLALIGLALPGLFWLAVQLGRRLARAPVGARAAFVAQAYALAPLGLAAWIAFSLTFALTNLSYLWPVVSDPFSWGWNLLGTAAVAWTPYGGGLLAPLQVLVLVGGLAWSSATARRIAGERLAPAQADRQAWPVIGFCLLLTVGLLWLLVG